MAQTEERPEADVSVDFGFFKQPYTVNPYASYVDDEPDNDTTYIWCSGEPFGNPISAELTITDVPDDLIETTQLKLRVKWQYLRLGHVYQFKGRYRLRSLVPDPDWEWEVEIFEPPVDIPLHYDEWIIPATLTKDELNDLRWLWHLDDDYSAGIYGFDWRVTEVRLEIDYIATSLAHEICTPATFKTVLNVRGTIPECN